MRIRHLPQLIALCLLLVLQGCAMAPPGPSTTELAATVTIPAAEPMLDHFIAWVPRDAAQTATAARALAHTTLGSARKQAGDHLCDGIWIGNSTITNVVGPIPAWASTAKGGYAAWYYRVSHLPGLKGCTTASDVQVYQAMEANLPQWMHVQTANSTIVKKRPLETVTLLEKQ